MFFERKITAFNILIFMCCTSFLSVVFSAIYSDPKKGNDYQINNKKKAIVQFNLPDPFANTFHDNKILRSDSNRLLVVWTPKCRSCMKNMPQVLPTNSINIVHNSSEDELKKTNEISLSQSKTLLDRSGLFAMNMRIFKLPTYIVVDSNGYELTRSEEVLSSEVKQLLAL